MILTPGRADVVRSVSWARLATTVSAVTTVDEQLRAAVEGNAGPGSR